MLPDAPTYIELGERFGVSRTRAWQIEQSAIAKLRDGLTPLARDLGILDKPIPPVRAKEAAQ